MQWQIPTNEGQSKEKKQSKDDFFDFLERMNTNSITKQDFSRQKMIFLKKDFEKLVDEYFVKLNETNIKGYLLILDKVIKFNFMYYDVWLEVFFFSFFFFKKNVFFFWSRFCFIFTLLCLRILWL